MKSVNTIEYNIAKYVNIMKYKIVKMLLLWNIR